MKFISNKVVFGRHETFHLKLAWLPKGFRAIQENSKLFKDIDSATVTLGVGKNMVLAIRYWLQAAQIIDSKDNLPTPLGKYLLDSKTGKDPFLEDQGSLWLIHWLLASNTESATTIAWFFSKYHKTNFNQNELRTALSSYLKEKVKDTQRPALTTLKNDISVLARMYTKAQGATVAEDTLDSLLSELGLIIEQGKSTYTSFPDDRDDLPFELIGFAILEFMNKRASRKLLPINELTQASGDFISIGSLFRLTEAALMVKLEELTRSLPQYFELRDTAGLSQLYLKEEIPPIKLLDAYYERSAKNLESAA